MKKILLTSIFMASVLSANSATPMFDVKKSFVSSIEKTFAAEYVEGKKKIDIESYYSVSLNFTPVLLDNGKKYLQRNIVLGSYTENGTFIKNPLSEEDFKKMSEAEIKKYIESQNKKSIPLEDKVDYLERKTEYLNTNGNIVQFNITDPKNRSNMIKCTLTGKEKSIPSLVEIGYKSPKWNYRCENGAKYESSFEVKPVENAEDMAFVESNSTFETKGYTESTSTVYKIDRFGKIKDVSFGVADKRMEIKAKQ